MVSELLTQMKQFWMNVSATLLAAALVGNVAFLFSVNERLARLEAIISAAGLNIAKK